jgi:hypothetical protein
MSTQIATRSSATYEALQDKLNPCDWRVEGINYECDGEIYVTIFSGPLAHERAIEYAEFKSNS